MHVLKKLLISSTMTLAAISVTYANEEQTKLTEISSNLQVKNELRFSQAEIAEDFEVFLHFLKTTHPNLETSSDPTQLEMIAERVRQSFHEDMSVRDAWLAMALINPVLGDAHAGVRRPVEALTDYEKEGGLLFPAPIIINEAGVMKIARAVPEGTGVWPGDEVLSINGISSHEILEKLKPRMRGRSMALRRLVMEKYFPEYFWTTYGGYDRYIVRIRNEDGIQNVELKEVEGTADMDPFSYQKLNKNAGYLNVASFDIQQKDRFEAFLKEAFDSIKDDGINTLIIDLRENTGGAHDLSDLLMAYLTGKSYSAISGVTARVTEENSKRIPGAKLGTVVTLPFQQNIQPPENYPLRFNGAVYALIGRLTYSQAIVFAATLQDHDIATIVGEETEGAANQSGQVQLFTMPHTGLQGLAPIYIFKRANGDTSNRGVIPDIDIENDPLNPMGSVNKLLLTLPLSN